MDPWGKDGLDNRSGRLDVGPISIWFRLNSELDRVRCLFNFELNDMRSEPDFDSPSVWALSRTVFDFN